MERLRSDELAPMLRVVRLGWRDRNVERSASAISHESIDSTERTGNVMMGKISRHSLKERPMKSKVRVLIGELLSVWIVQREKEGWKSIEDPMVSVFSPVILDDLLGLSTMSGRFADSLRTNLESEGFPIPTIFWIVVTGREMIDILL